MVESALSIPLLPYPTDHINYGCLVGPNRSPNDKIAIFLPGRYPGELQI